jgi:hypothetical protein
VSCANACGRQFQMTCKLHLPCAPWPQCIACVTFPSRDSRQMNSESCIEPLPNFLVLAVLPSVYTVCLECGFQSIPGSMVHSASQNEAIKKCCRRLWRNETRYARRKFLQFHSLTFSTRGQVTGPNGTTNCPGNYQGPRPSKFQAHARIPNCTKA